MNKGDAVQRVADRVGNRTDLDTKIATEMSLIQATELERGPIMPFFLLTENYYTDTEVGEQRIRVPTDFLREYELGALWLYTEGATEPWLALQKDGEQDLRDALGNTIALTGPPRFYSLTGEYFRVYPIPDGVYRVYTKYYRSDTAVTALTDSQTNQWLTYAPDLLCAWATENMLLELQAHPSRIDRAEQRRMQAWERYWRDQEARAHTNRRYVMGQYPSRGFYKTRGT